MPKYYNGKQIISRYYNGKALLTKSPYTRDYFRFTALEANARIICERHGSLPHLKMQYSKDGTNWTDWESGGVNLVKDEILYVRNLSDKLSTSGPDHINFYVSGGFVKVSGNIHSLINFKAVSPYCFMYLFESNFLISDASELILPALALTPHCYEDMFYDCVGLRKAPELPATELEESCYNEMFSGCRDLTNAPSSLPAMKLAKSCYLSMFEGCTSLKTVNFSLPATKLAVECYKWMFYGCTALTNAPQISATEFDTDCLRAMFGECTALKVNENGAGTNIITIPPNVTDTESIASNMFYLTGGSFTGTPTTGNIYNWYTE